jgi:hypothetical protein
MGCGWFFDVLMCGYAKSEKVGAVYVDIVDAGERIDAGAVGHTDEELSFWRYVKLFVATVVGMQISVG